MARSVSRKAEGANVDAALQALQRNLDAVEVLNNRLVKCAGTVMKTETEVSVVQPAVHRLVGLRRQLQDAAQEVEKVRCSLVPHTSGDAAKPENAEALPLILAEAAAEVLPQLSVVMDKAHSLLASRPNAGSDNDDSILDKDKDKDRQEFRIWVRGVLLEQDSDHQ